MMYDDKEKLNLFYGDTKIPFVLQISERFTGC